MRLSKKRERELRKEKEGSVRERGKGVILMAKKEIKYGIRDGEESYGTGGRTDSVEREEGENYHEKKSRRLKQKVMKL